MRRLSPSLFAFVDGFTVFVPAMGIGGQALRLIDIANRDSFPWEPSVDLRILGEADPVVLDREDDWRAGEVERAAADRFWTTWRAA